MSVLVDTSVWVEFLRGTDGPGDRWIVGAVRDGTGLAWTEPVLFELLSGATSPRRAAELRALVLRGPAVRSVGLVDWEAAAELARLTRLAGRPVRSTVDFLVAAVALRADLPVATVDRDFEAIAAVAPLRLVPLVPPGPA